jgi:glutaredoxin
MKRLLLAMFLSAAGSTLLAAQLYRWVDEKGNVEWRDTPPPVGAKKVEQRTLGGTAPPAAGLPYDVQVAVKNFPVTLWTASCGAACDQAKAHLVRRGVPHTEKDAQAEIDAFQKLTGGTDVPVLYVGRTQIKGYLDSQYDSALDAAGYPRTPPPGFKPAPPKAPAAKPAEEPKAPAAKPGTAQSGPPVKLYTFPDCGAPCRAAKTLLAGRRIPFTEAVVGVNTSANELQRVSGDLRVPVLVVGDTIERAYQEEIYHKALDAAGYSR